MIRQHAETSSPEDQLRSDRNHGFVIGLLTGGVLGAGVGWMLAPRLSAFGRQTADSVRSLGAAANDRYHQAGARMTAVVDDLTEKGQELPGPDVRCGHSRRTSRRTPGRAREVRPLTL